jgi:hypothetical protein
VRYVPAMLEDFVISGLVKRHAALAGEIVHVEKQLKQKLLDQKTLVAAIKLFDADYPIETIKPTGVYSTKNWDKRGELTRLVFDILREACMPMSARDIALQVMLRKQMDTSRPNLIISIRRRVGEALRRNQARGHVHSQERHGQPLLWEMATPLPVANNPSIAC